ncbi:A24 family peptidase [Streptomyces sp. DH12]|uniref:prepilin peptidase n=1 Tax=Streptomyces sp. DH12 TaxID=2857010 RepID=UPI001E43A08C|nr:A24 family peptidase [Streptomyces sp. DH12]
MDATLIAVAALWGAAAGALAQRAAYRLAVEPDDPWRTACPAGHPYAPGPRGWLGPARCPACAPADRPAATPPGEATAPRGDATAPSSDATAPPGEAATAPARAATPPARPATPPARPATPPARPATPPAGAATPPSPARRPRPAVVPAVVGAAASSALAAATGYRPELAVWLLAAPFALLLAVVDRRVHRLPDLLTLPLAAALPLLLGAAALLPGHAGSWRTAVLGGLALGGAYLVLFLVNPDGMGFGDVKLALPLGCALGWYGWGVLLSGAFAGFLLGALYGLGLVALRRANRRTAIPFGPFMIGGALLGVLFGALAHR